jgi:hypothetical protein
MKPTQFPLTRFRNLAHGHGYQRCTFCADHGWLTLKGTVMDMGVEYERGDAPCKACDLGNQLRQTNTHRQFPDYSVAEVDPASIAGYGVEQPLSLYEYATSDAGKADPNLAPMVALLKGYSEIVKPMPALDPPPESPGAIMPPQSRPPVKPMDDQGVSDARDA